MKSGCLPRAIIRSSLFVSLVAIFLSGASPVLAQSLKVPYAALSPTYAPLWVAEQGGYFNQLPIQYPGGTIVLSKSFLQNRRELVKRFLRGWVEGVKTARIDKEFTVKVLQKYLQTTDRDILDRTFDVYKDVHEKIPAPDPKVMGVALKQLAATIPQSAQLRAEDFIDRSLISELEGEGFIARLYGGR